MSNRFQTPNNRSNGAAGASADRQWVHPSEFCSQQRTRKIRRRVAVRAGCAVAISAVVLYTGYVITATPDGDSIHHQVVAESD